MRVSTSVALIVGMLAIAGCGQTPGERAISGGVLGAGAGAAAGAAIPGLSLGEGALIGGAAGAIGGALTTPPQRRYYY
jgi:hypothetical protein